MTPKKLGKAFLCRLLERQVKRLRKKNDFKIIAVAGSVGKTSTKLAIAKTLATNQRVMYQAGNYNDRLTVPLVFFGETEPGIYDVFAWLKILRSNKGQLKQPYPYDIVVVELGTDGSGQMKKFAYLQPDITVITAIADEHMEQFKTLEAVALEELAPLGYSKQILLNIDDTPEEYLPASTYQSYGLHKKANYMVSRHLPASLQSQKLTFALPGSQSLMAEVAALGEQGAKIALAAVAVSDLLKVPLPQVKESLRVVTPFAGRMQVLAGKQGSIILDDTYNASPIAAKAALDVLYGADTQHRIAILGSMNELGTDSPKMHQEVGGYCDPAKLELIVTIGKAANEYLAPVAEKKGCSVKTFDNPYAAGAYVLEHIQAGAVVLAKGSQNGVFAEEALKVLLANPSQSRKLVRQSEHWLTVKRHQFPNS